MVKIKRFCRGRKGFSLIEVIIALAILVVVVLALEFSYYSYYRNVTDLRIKTIGQNLAQLQVEDIQNLAASVIASDIIDSTTGYPPNYPPDTSPTEHVYDSDKINGKFEIERLTHIILLDSDGNPHDFTNGSETADGMGLNDLLLLPSSIVVDPVDTDGVGGNDHYTLTLHKEVFPNYTKEIKITDETPDISAPYKKIYKIEVTVYWNEGGTEKSITVTGEKNDARSS